MPHHRRTTRQIDHDLPLYLTGPFAVDLTGTGSSAPTWYLVSFLAVYCLLLCKKRASRVIIQIPHTQETNCLPARTKQIVVRTSSRHESDTHKFNVRAAFFSMPSRSLYLLIAGNYNLVPGSYHHGTMFYYPTVGIRVHVRPYLGPGCYTTHSSTRGIIPGIDGRCCHP